MLLGKNTEPCDCRGFNYAILVEQLFQIKTLLFRKSKYFRMKSILIIGASHSGKSTTISEVCKRLNPEKVWRLIAYKDDYKKSFLEEDVVERIFNNTFIIKVKNKLILIVSGAPTEQNIRITVLIKICIEIDIKIDFVFIAMRTFEKKQEFETKNELRRNSQIILEEKIYKIPDEKYREHRNWINRVDRITKLILEDI
jgi:hypothetical protein